MALSRIYLPSSTGPPPPAYTGSGTAALAATLAATGAGTFTTPQSYTGAGTAVLAAVLAATGAGVYTAPTAPTYIGSGTAAQTANLAANGIGTYAAPTAPVYVGSGTGALTVAPTATGAGTFVAPVIPSYTGSGTGALTVAPAAVGAGTFVAIPVYTGIGGPVLSAALSASGAGTYESTSQVVFAALSSPINFYVSQPVTVSLSPSVSGGSGSYVYSVETGTLPTGTSLDPNTGNIAGTPSVNGNTNVSFRAADSIELTNFAISNVVNVIVSTPTELGGIWKGGLVVPFGNNIYAGATPVNEVWKGGTKVWARKILSPLFSGNVTNPAASTSFIIDPQKAIDGDFNTYAFAVNFASTVATLTMLIGFPAIVASNILRVRFYAKVQGTSGPITSSISTFETNPGIPAPGIMRLRGAQNQGAVTYDSGLVNTNQSGSNGFGNWTFQAGQFVGSSQAVLDWWANAGQKFQFITTADSDASSGRLYEVQLQVEYLP